MINRARIHMGRYCIALLLLSLAALAQSNNGYSVPASGIGLTFELCPGTCTALSGTVVKYAGSRITLVANATNYGYLDTTCTLAQNTGGFPAGDIPVWIAITNATDVTSMVDSRTSYNFTGAGSSGLPTAGNGDHVTTTFLASGGVNGDCVDWLSGGSLGDTGAPCGVTPGGVVKNPSAGVNQDVVQQVGTELSANIFANHRYVTSSFNWSQTDVAGSVGNLAAAGAGKVFTLTPSPLGFDPTIAPQFPYAIYISGAGTPE